MLIFIKNINGLSKLYYGIFEHIFQDKMLPSIKVTFMICKPISQSEGKAQALVVVAKTDYSLTRTLNGIAKFLVVHMNGIGINRYFTNNKRNHIIRH